MTRSNEVSLSFFGLAFLLVAVFCAEVQSHEDGHEPPKRIDTRVQHKPSVLPDRIVLTWSGDPAHSQDVNWRTSTDVKRAFVEYAVATPGPYFVSNATRIEASTESFKADLGNSHRHSATMKALAPSTKYVYRVGDGKNWSEWFHFTSASVKPEPFTFIYFGDAQNAVRSMWSRIIREAQADAPRAAFLLHAGDLINTANRDAEWGEWFGGGAWLNAMIPSIATPGNHEYSKKTVKIGDKEVEERAISRQWRPSFSFPLNGPEGLEESVYWIDYQGARIISLNSNEQHEVQAAWVDKVLEANTQRWTIVTFHHPMYSSAEGRDNKGLRQLWKPIFDKHNVDIVLQGHDHTYARTGLDLPVDAENLETGVTLKAGPTVYVVSVSGPKQYDVGKREFFQRSASGAQLYQIIHINGDTLNFEARVANGELYDAFTLTKRAGKSNELINRAPDSLENRKPQSIDLKALKDLARKVRDDVKAQQAKAAAKKEFAKLDKDEDGQLSKDELSAEMKKRLDKIDVDEDGFVSVEEFAAAAK